jgi:hypothetical protein
MRLRGLDISLHEGPTLDDVVIDEMCALRAQFMRLKPDVHPADDRALVAAWLCAPECTVVTGRDRVGALQWFVDMCSRRIEHRGRAHVVCYSNYGFVSLAYRGHPGYALGNLRNLLVHRRRHGVTPRLVWIGAVYPASFVVVARTFPMVWATREPDAPSALVSIVDRVAPELFGDAWLPEEQLVRTRTLPPPHAPKSPEGRALLERYEALNPRWHEGYALPLVSPLSLGNLLGGGRLLVRRLA